MDQVYLIRHKLLIEGKSIRQVARELGLSRPTVKKYLAVAEPKRVEAQPRPTPVTDQVAPRIDQLLQEWQSRTTRKQRLTGTRLHRQLREEGFQVGTTTVREYLREKRRLAREVFIPLSYRAGDVAQVDFFEVTVDVAGVQRTAWKFLLRLMYSGADYVRLYERCDQLSFLDAHVRAFAHLGGVVRRLAYDNLSPAVRKIVGSERQLTERFAALSSHYLFEPCFARPGEGHDKGGVESRGKAIRLQHLTPIPQGDTLDAISAQLLADLDERRLHRVSESGRSVQALFEEERQCLLPLPVAQFEVSRVTLVSITNRATVQIERTTYSVPSRWARLEATAYVGVEAIRLVCQGEELILERQRPGSRAIRYRHYLPELARKPQATRQVAAQLTKELGEPYAQLWEMLEARYGGREAGRVLSRLLGAMVERGEETVTQALQKVREASRPALFSSPAGGEPVAPLMSIRVPAALQGYEVEAGHASDYDWLLEGGVR